MELGRELLKVDGVSKAFPGVLANDAIAFDLRAGEVHALIGENGAGKTTLMGILFGLHTPDAGRIIVNGKELAPGNPHEAIIHGIGFVQQHYSLIPTLTVIENLVLTSRYGAGRSVPRAEIEKRVRETSQRYGFTLELNTPVERLSVSEQQHLELIKALLSEPRILILDEPAALLTAEEVKQLWRILRDLAETGVGIILIGHKLEEVLAIADRITVLRQGCAVATIPARDVDAGSLGEMMVGELRTSDREAAKSGPIREGAPVLETRELWVSGDRSPHLVKDVSFSVRRGEVLGIAGIAGGGQIELLEAIAGIRPVERGTTWLHGQDINNLTTRERQIRGIAFIPADRHRDGLIGPMSLAENLALCSRRDSSVSRSGILLPRSIETRAQSLMRRFDIRAFGPAAPAANLSGGNQQKLILARELSRDPEVLLCCYPTRGLDFAATRAVHDELTQAAQRGAAVVIVSIDLVELLELSDRLIVIQAGRITGEVEPDQVSVAEVGVMLGGGIAT